VVREFQPFDIGEAVFRPLLRMNPAEAQRFVRDLLALDLSRSVDAKRYESMAARSGLPSLLRPVIDGLPDTQRGLVVEQSNPIQALFAASLYVRVGADGVEPLPRISIAERVRSIAALQDSLFGKEIYGEISSRSSPNEALHLAARVDGLCNLCLRQASGFPEAVQIGFEGLKVDLEKLSESALLRALVLGAAPDVAMTNVFGDTAHAWRTSINSQLDDLARRRWPAFPRLTLETVPSDTDRVGQILFCIAALRDQRYQGIEAALQDSGLDDSSLRAQTWKYGRGPQAPIAQQQYREGENPNGWYIDLMADGRPVEVLNNSASLEKLWQEGYDAVDGSLLKTEGTWAGRLYKISRKESDIQAAVPELVERDRRESSFRAPHIVAASRLLVAGEMVRDFSGAAGAEPRRNEILWRNALSQPEFLTLLVQSPNSARDLWTAEHLGEIRRQELRPNMQTDYLEKWNTGAAAAFAQKSAMTGLPLQEEVREELFRNPEVDPAEVVRFILKDPSAISASSRVLASFCAWSARQADGNLSILEELYSGLEREPLLQLAITTEVALTKPSEDGAAFLARRACGSGSDREVALLAGYAGIASALPDLVQAYAVARRFVELAAEHPGNTAGSVHVQAAIHATLLARRLSLLLNQAAREEAPGARSIPGHKLSIFVPAALEAQTAQRQFSQPELITLLAAPEKNRFLDLVQLRTLGIKADDVEGFYSARGRTIADGGPFSLLARGISGYEGPVAKRISDFEKRCTEAGLALWPR
jgi:hypothetical protein